ncbi:MAG: prepilin-type N-terminal cleavage/methylation domain-containing protein [Desulfuromonadales bacterium]|nr:prepilin-type N-terminal cleavage/methylation domain-containing protein [Desulfuromonadales bacterium]
MQRRYPLSGKRSCRGMTLVEILMVLAIFAIVMMAVMSLYIPVLQSSQSQSQVADMQSNLRLAMERMTTDIQTAGFLVDQTEEYGGFTAGAVYWPDTATANSEFYLRTRLVGSGYARLLSVSGEVVTLADESMSENFPVGTSVRLFSPTSCEEHDSGGVYTVEAVVGSDELRLSDGPGNDDTASLVLVRIGSSTDARPRVIQYVVEDTDGDGEKDTLIRRILDQDHTNPKTQYLARNVSEMQLLYLSSTGGLSSTPPGQVKEISISLIGKTGPENGQGLLTEKTRVLKSSAELRNVFVSDI